MTDLEEAPTRRRRHRLTIPDGEGNDDLGSTCNGREESEDSKAHLKRRPHTRKSKGRRSRDLEQPFYVLFLQVGTTLFVFCALSFLLFRAFIPTSPIPGGSSTDAGDKYTDDDDNLNWNEIEAAPTATEAAVPTPSPTKPTAPPLPVWELGDATVYDAFGVAELYESSHHQQQNAKDHGPTAYQEFWTTAASLRSEFAGLYGGENAVRAMMERSMTFFPDNRTDSKEASPQQRPQQHPPSDLVATACRIRNAKREDRPFKFTFGGYSVTVGRGNYFHQSFPFVMERILRQPFELLGVDLSVKNAAIGGYVSLWFVF